MLSRNAYYTKPHAEFERCLIRCRSLIRSLSVDTLPLRCGKLTYR